MSVLKINRMEKINNILNNRLLKINDIYDNYKFGLITRQQKEDVKKELLKYDFINEIYNKNNKITGYKINKDKIDDFKEWLNKNFE